MSNDRFWEEISNCAEQSRKELHARWAAWKLDPAKLEVHEALGGLMARQVTLFTQMASNPGIWNGHVAPLLLRSMVDTYITFAWTFQDKESRSRLFIYHGLGQEKLHLEHFKAALSESGEEVDDHPFVEAITNWIDSQRWTFLTDVNLGSWSGKSTRAMAEEANCMDIYNHAYHPFSAAVHGMWNHVAKYNLIYCNNPLHKGHRIPVDNDLGIDPDFLYRSAKYLQKTFSTFDENTGVLTDEPKTLELLEKAFEEHLSEHVEADG